MPSIAPLVRYDVRPPVRDGGVGSLEFFASETDRGERSALVISANALNHFSLDVCVIPLASVQHRQFSLRPRLDAGEGGLSKVSWAKCDQVTTLEKDFAVYPPIGSLGDASLHRIEQAVRTALEL